MTIREVDSTYLNSGERPLKRQPTRTLSRDDLDKALRVAHVANTPQTRAGKMELNEQLLKMGTNGGTESDND